ncbi:MAG: lysylphosphatidylglycerol synthase transmembrane domain-containing protein [Bacillota bacterium]
MSIRSSILFMIGGLVAFIVYLYFYIGIPQILEVLSNINSGQYAFYYSLALVAVLASVLCWSLAWNSILNALAIKIALKKTYLYYWVGYFSDLVLPCATVCGELTRLYLAQKETGESYGVLAASAITNRLIAYIIVAAGLYSGAALVFLKPGLTPVIANIFVLFLIGVTIYLAVLLYLAFVKQSAKNFSEIYQKILKKVSPKRYSVWKKTQREKTLSGYYNGFKIFRENPRLIAKPLFIHLVSYLLGLSVYIAIFYALGIPQSPEFYVVIFFIATAVQDAAASFSVGSLDIILASILLLYGINPGLSAVTALLLRSVGFWFPLFVGFIGVQVLGARELISHTPRLEMLAKKKPVSSQKNGLSSTD